MTVVSLTHEKFRRERFVIVLADQINQVILNEDPLDPEPLAPFLLSVADELRGAEEDEIESHYRWAVASFTTPPGELVHFNMEVEPYHAGALTWARGRLAEVENALGIHLMERGRT